MPVSKHVKAKRRIQGTTYKLVPRSYSENQLRTNSDGTVTRFYTEADAEEAQHDWVPEEEIHKAYKNIRGRGKHSFAESGEDGNPFLSGGVGNGDYDAYDLGEDADYWEEGEEGEYYEEGEEEWVDDDEAFDEMFGDDDNNNEDDAAGQDGTARAPMLVRDPQQQRRKGAATTATGKSEKTVKFNFGAPPAASSAPLGPAIRKPLASHEGSGEEEEDELAEPRPHGHRAHQTGKRGRRMESVDDMMMNDGDEEEEGDGVADYEYGEPDAFDAQYELDEWANNRRNKNRKKNAATASRGGGGVAGAAAGTVASGEAAEMGAVEAEGDDRLFVDEMECEVTDEFLRQLVFGAGPPTASSGAHWDDDDDGDFDFGDEDDGDGDDGMRAGVRLPAGMDKEVWNLLTEEERAGVLESQRRGTTRRRQQRGGHAKGNTVAHDEDNDDDLFVDAAGAAGDMLVDEQSGMRYPQHATSERRALERQFDQMMAEFEGDMPINDFFATDADGNATAEEFTDPRTMGALSIDKYFSALEEFVEKRAGVDMETNEPRKNKGLLTQLKYLAHNAGAFDYNERDHGVFLTNNVSDKQRKFVEEFRTETEHIKREAKMRVLKRMLENKRRKEAGLPTLEEEEEQRDLERAIANGGKFVPPPGEEETYELVEVRDRRKEDRLDCETAVSAYSSYYNQPNVIRAPAPKKKRKNPHQSVSAPRSTEARHEMDDHSSSDNSNDGRGPSSSVAPESVSYVRSKHETKEEKKARRQAVKQLQRERRQEKSNLKKAYKDVEKEETVKAAVSQNAKRTIKFM